MRGKHGNHAKASRQHRWKPGSRVGSTGYVKVRVGKGHPLADPNGWAYEHVVVWCAAGNTRPMRGEILHHINEDKTDNRLENLALMTRGDRRKSICAPGTSGNRRVGRAGATTSRSTSSPRWSTTGPAMKSRRHGPRS